MRIEKFFIFHFFLLLNCIVYGQNTPLNNKFKIDEQIANRDTGRFFFGILMIKINFTQTLQTYLTENFSSMVQ